MVKSLDNITIKIKDDASLVSVITSIGVFYDQNHVREFYLEE